jgi:hypothetical protein
MKHIGYYNTSGISAIFALPLARYARSKIIQSANGYCSLVMLDTRNNSGERSAACRVSIQ